MTVKEAVNVLTEAKQLYICWDGNLTHFDPHDTLMMDAYGGYKVKRICTAGDAEDAAYEIAIAAIPVKVGGN